jgi:two-component system invasion response regulator UvrY
MSAAQPLPGAIRVLLVDDHMVVRIGFRMLLDATPDIRVVAEAECAESACRECRAAQPDVVLMDIGLGGANGVEATRRILAREDGPRVLALSSHEDPSYVRAMMKAGALGYVSKRSAPEELLDAIRQVAQGRRYFDAHVSRRMAMHEFEAQSPVDALSEREFAVFVELARGMTVNQIAAAMNISPRTAGTHLYNIKQKLCASNQAELALIAIRHGVIEP